MKITSLLMVAVAAVQSVQCLDFADVLSFEKMDELRPLLLKAPKALPLMAGKVESPLCKDQGKTVGIKAGQYSEADMTEEIMKGIICEMSTECVSEYVEAVRKLVKMPLTQQVLQVKDASQIDTFADMALPAFELLCTDLEAEKEL